MNFWLSRDILDSLGWTLLHFLWQGLVIVALFAVAMRLFRRRSANIRYLVGCFALLLMALAPLLTFYSLAQSDEAEMPTLIVQKGIVTYGAENIQLPITAPQINLPIVAKPVVHKPGFSELLESSLPWLVTAWSLGVLALSCRLFAGWLLIQRLRRTATTALTEPWQTKLKELARRVGVSRPLRLLQSALVEVPTVIGWLRPVILLPASCLIGLTPEQLESILAHELAHIRRHDYLINLLQNVVETLLFYHPAVWWVSRRIRQEREHCCDDLAVKICGDPLAYARALATLEELRPAPAQLQLAASGAPLLERIRRLAGQPERSPARPAWPVAGVISVLLLALLAAALRNNPAAAQPVAEPPATNEVKISSAPTNAIAQTNLSPGHLVPASKPFISATTLQPGPPQNSFTTKLKKLPSPTNTVTQVDNPPLPQINLKVKWAEIDAATSASTDAAWPFKPDDLQNFPKFPATFQFSDFLSIRPTNAAQPEYNIFLHTNSSTAPLGLVVPAAQFKAAINTLEQHVGVDLLTAPEVTTEMGRQAQVQAVDVESVVYGRPKPVVKAGVTNWPAVKTMPFGPVVDIVPHLAADGHTVQLTVVGSVTEFVGYENPTGVTNTDGKPMPADWGIPHMRVRQFTANVEIENAETMVLGAAAVPITTPQTTKHKVPILGDIPVLGHLFRSSKTVTNTTQKSLMLFITPTLVNPDGTRYRPPPTKERSSPDRNQNPSAILHTNAAGQVVYTSKGRQSILSKLDRIRVDSVAYDGLPLTEVINNLSMIAQAQDPEKTGINFFISHEAITATIVAAAPDAIDPATGLPTAPVPTYSAAEINSATVTINPPLKDVRLADVLDAIVRTSDKPIKYSILDYAVVFSPLSLETRTFHVNPHTFIKGLESVDGVPFDATATNTVPGINFNPPSHLQVSVRHFFTAVGADFSTNNPANAGKAFIWGSRKGLLTVRATANDLDLIATALQALAEHPPLVNFKAKFALFDREKAPVFGFNVLNTNLPPSSATNLYVAVTNSGGAITASFASFMGILTKPQYKVALQALEQQDKNAHLLDAPEVTCESWLSSRISPFPPMKYAKDANGISNPVFEPVSEDIKPFVPLNPAVDVFPSVSQDGSLHMGIITTVTEITSPDLGQLKPDMEGNPPRISSIAMASKYRRYTNDVTMLDGQTIILTVPVSNDPAVDPGRALDKSTNAPIRSHRALTIFITPTIVNPDGTPRGK